MFDILAPAFIAFSLLGTIALLSWLSDIEGVRSVSRYIRECKSRNRLSKEQFYDQYYQSSGIEPDTIARLRSLVAEVHSVELELIVPTDNYSAITGGIYDDEFVERLESEFGIVFSPDELESVDGSFDSIARLVNERTRCASGR